MTTLEELGLLKMDFLGLRTLTVIQDAVKLMKRVPAVLLIWMQIDYNDKKVLASIGTGQNGRRVPAGKCRNEELHEGTEAPEPGGCDRGNFPVSSGSHGFYPEVHSG